MLLEKEISELENSISYSDRVNKNISAKGVDWHVDHTLRVINQVYKALENSTPSDYKWHFNFTRTAIFLLGFIPRGKARAPKSVVATEEITTDDLITQLSKAKVRLKEFEKLPANSNFPHPFFGTLNLKMTCRFLKIHTRHHLKIIRDIIHSK